MGNSILVNVRGVFVPGPVFSFRHGHVLSSTRNTSPILFDAPRVITDVETWCPGREQRHHIIEIAAIVYDRCGRIARGWLNREGFSAGSPADPPLFFHRLCRPRSLPRHVRFFNAIDPDWLWHPDVRSEDRVVRDFVSWHGRCAHSVPLIAFNSSFDRNVLRRSLDAAGHVYSGDEPLPWGPCLMKEAARLLTGSRSRISKDSAARQVLDGDGALKRAAAELGYRGPLTMHLGLPDALLEGALMVALRQRERSVE